MRCGASCNSTLLPIPPQERAETQNLGVVEGEMIPVMGGTRVQRGRKQLRARSTSGHIALRTRKAEGDVCRRRTPS